MDDKVIVAAIFAVVIVIALLLFRRRVKATLSGPFKSKLAIDASNPDPQTPGAVVEDATSRRGSIKAEDHTGKGAVARRVEAEGDISATSSPPEGHPGPKAQPRTRSVSEGRAASVTGSNAGRDVIVVAGDYVQYGTLSPKEGTEKTRLGMPDQTRVLPDWMKQSFDLLKVLAAPGVILLSATLAIHNYLELLQGDWGTAAWILGGVGLLFLIGGLIHISFGRNVSSICDAEGRVVPLYRYPKIYRSARAVLVGVVIAGLLGGLYLYRKDRELAAKVVVLITKFKGREPENYQVTDDLLADLKLSVAGYEDTIIKTVPIEVTEDQGSAFAQALGRRYRARLVLWGRYSFSNQEERIIVNVENLSGTRSVNLPPTNPYKARVNLNDLDHFQLMGRVSGEMSAFVLFLGGVIRYEAGDFQDAVARLTSALDKGVWPDQVLTKAMVYVARGRAYYYLRKYDRVIDDDSEAIRIDPDEPIAYHNRGCAYLLLKRKKEALDDFSRAIEIRSDYASSYFNRAIVQVELKRGQDALDDVNKGLSLDSTQAFGYYSRGIVYDELSDYKKAIGDYNVAISKSPTFVAALLNRGLAYEQLGGSKDAIADYSAAIRLHHDYAPAYVMRAEVYWETKHYEQAVRDYAKAIEIDHDYAPAYVGRGDMHYEMGRYEDALRDYSTAIEMNPTDGAAHLNRGNIYYGQQRNREALEDYSKGIEIEGESCDSNAFLFRARVYCRERRFPEALSDYAKALLSRPNDVGLLLERGLVLLDTGQPQNAMLDFDAALRLQPRYTRAILAHGICYRYIGQIDQAIKDFSKAIDLCERGGGCRDESDGPDEHVLGNVHFFRGLAEFESEDLVGAIFDWQDAMRIAPDIMESRQDIELLAGLAGYTPGSVFDTADLLIRLNERRGQVIKAVRQILGTDYVRYKDTARNKPQPTKDR